MKAENGIPESVGELIDRRTNLADIEWFGEYDANIHAFVGFADLGGKICRDDDDLTVNPALTNLTHQFHAGQVRHLLIDDDDIEWGRAV